MKGATDMITKIGQAIFLLDHTIDDWAQLLHRAQPHRNGRLALIFSNTDSVLLDDERIYEVAPVVGRMLQLKSGAWHFYRLKATEKYTKLSDLRVGQSLPSDPLVIRIIDGIEDLLSQRDHHVKTLSSLRLGVPGKVAATLASCTRRGDEIIDLEKRLKLDWSVGAEAAEESIRADRRQRYAAVKLSKKTQKESTP